MAITPRTRGRRGKALRRRRFADGMGLCAMCLKRGIDEPGVEVDHIIPLHKGGKDEDANCQVLCRACHHAKTQDERPSRKVRIGADGWPEESKPAQ